MTTTWASKRVFTNAKEAKELQRFNQKRVGKVFYYLSLKANIILTTSGDDVEKKLILWGHFMMTSPTKKEQR